MDSQAPARREYQLWRGKGGGWGLVPIPQGEELLALQVAAWMADASRSQKCSLELAWTSRVTVDRCPLPGAGSISNWRASLLHLSPCLFQHVLPSFDQYRSINVCLLDHYFVSFSLIFAISRLTEILGK